MYFRFLGNVKQLEFSSWVIDISEMLRDFVLVSRAQFPCSDLVEGATRKLLIARKRVTQRSLL